MKQYNVEITSLALDDMNSIYDYIAKALIEVIRNNPYQTPPSYEKLVGDLFGMYSRRINRQHRIVYQVFEDEKIVKIIRMWTHYEK